MKQARRIVINQVSTKLIVNFNDIITFNEKLNIIEHQSKKKKGAQFIATTWLCTPFFRDQRIDYTI